MVEQIILAHLQYLDDIVKYTEEHGEKPPTPKPTECSLGTWYYGAAQQNPAIGQHPKFATLGELHEQFHSVTKEAVEAAAAGDDAKAKELTSQAFPIFSQIEHILLDLPA